MLRLLQPLPILLSKSTKVSFGVRFWFWVSQFFSEVLSIVEIYKLLVDKKKYKLFEYLQNLFGLVNIRKDLGAF